MYSEYLMLLLILALGIIGHNTTVASAVIIAADAGALTARANRLEAALHSPQRYRPDSTTAIADYAAANAEAVAATLRDLLQNGAATWPET